MKGVLFIGGSAPEYGYIKNELKDADIIVAADSGFDSAFKMGINPDVVIGDMDSIKHVNMLDRYPSDKVFRFPKDKDTTDTELGISYLQENKFDKIVIAGEAKSHCVLETIRQILEHYQNDIITTQKIYILEDCMSNIPGFEDATELEFERFKKDFKVNIVNTKTFKL